MTHLSPWRHSLLIGKKAVGRLQRRFVKLPEQPMVGLVNGRVRFEHERLSFLDEGDLRAMLTNSYDIILCDYLKRYLSPGDIFIDIGANVGYISAIGASCVGTSGEVHGFEPLPECFARLKRLHQLNPEFRFTFNNVALGEEEGMLPIAYNPQGDSRNATLVPGKHFPESFQVPVRRLDDYILANIPSPERIKAIKIDVEGFEFSVLRGLSKFLAGTTSRPLIVCEVKPWEVTKLGGTLQDFDRYMQGFGYQVYVITQDDKPTTLADLPDMEVVVFRA